MGVSTCNYQFTCISKADAFKNMLHLAVKMIDTDLLGNMKSSFAAINNILGWSTTAMQSIFQYIVDYVRSLDKWLLAITALFVATLIFINYRFGIVRGFGYYPRDGKSFAGFYCNATAFIFPYIFSHLPVLILNFLPFLALLLIAPAIFATKVSRVQASSEEPATTLEKIL